MRKIISLVMVILLTIGAVPMISVAADNSQLFEFNNCGEYAELKAYNGTAQIVEIPSKYDGLPVTRIWPYAFRDNNTVQEVVIPDTVTEINNFAFLNCSNLTNVTFSDNLKYISSGAFHECKSLKKVSLPKSIMEIGEYAFGYYEDIKTGHYFLVDGFTMEGYTGSAAESYAYVNEISFVSVGTAPLWIWEIDDETHKLAYIVKYNGKEENLVVPQNLEGYEIIRIHTSALAANPYIETVTIPESVNYISSYAFEDCSNLTTVNFQGPQIRLSTRTFNNCTKLTTVNFNSIYEDYLDCEATVTTFLNTPYYENNFKDNAFYFGNSLLKVDTSVKSFTIKNGTRTISSEAFKDCTSLKTIYIPESVVEVGSSAFKGCTSLKSVEFADNRERYISDFAFLNCTSLKSITIPENTFLSYQSVGYIYGYIESQQSWDYSKLADFTIYGAAGSYAEQYAAQYGFNFSTGNSAHTHTYDNSCDESCNVCNATRSITHAYQTTTTKATLSKSGSVVKKCTVCDHVASKSTIKYAKTIKLSDTSYTYNGKAKKPTVSVKDSSGKKLTKDKDYTVSYAKGRKNVGTYKVTIKMKGNYSGTKTLTFKINPKPTKISKLTAAKKAIKVKIKKQSKQVKGYEIQYSTSKKFKKSKTKTIKSYKTTSATIKKLKAKKTYYVRVRTYKTVGGKKYYSAWSAYKSKKTK